MSNLGLEQIVQDLRAVNPALAEVVNAETGGKWVLLIEACNYAAKEARSNFQQTRDQFKAANPAVKQIPSEIKAWDEISGRLMKAAKNVLLSQALANGAEAFATQDANGQSVILLKHPEAGVIALHGINVDKLEDNDVRNRIKSSENSPNFTGFRRQRLAGILAEAVTGKASDGNSILGAIRKASIDKSFAEAVNNSLGGVEATQTLPDSTIINALLSHYNNG